MSLFDYIVNYNFVCVEHDNIGGELDNFGHRQKVNSCGMTCSPIPVKHIQ